MRTLPIAFACALLAAIPVATQAVVCTVPDNGNGSAVYPPDCPDGYQGHMQILEGLPIGSSIEIDARLADFFDIAEFPGGLLGGHVQTWSATLHMEMDGTGDLAGFHRSIAMPMSGETNTAPRMGDPVQQFPAELIFLSGSIFADPDFDNLSVQSGFNFGLPSPGLTTLTRLPDTTWNVDSFFDLTYRIDFVGAPGSILESFGGSSMGVDHFVMGEPYAPPADDHCDAPDNGNGGVDLPTPCPIRGEFKITEGLPADSPIIVQMVIQPPEPQDVVVMPGGGLLGHLIEIVSTAVFDLFGTGIFDGWTQHAEVPCSLLVATAPPVRDDVIELTTDKIDDGSSHLRIGENVGVDEMDVEFGSLVTGQSVATRKSGGGYRSGQRDGDFNVDSFIDADISITFHGADGGPLDGYAGTTDTRARLRQGEHLSPPVVECIAPDNGGSADLPPPCPHYAYIASLDGLPPGEPILGSITLEAPDPSDVQRFPGGMLGGEMQLYDTNLVFQLSGSGALSGFERSVVLPVIVETHSAPPQTGQPTQDIETVMVRLEGQIFGDPDFDFLRFTAGTSFLMAGPGRSLLDDLGDGNWTVDSFFDVAYRFEWQGAPEGPLAGLSSDGFGAAKLGTEMPAPQAPAEPKCEPEDNGSCFTDFPLPCPGLGEFSARFTSNPEESVQVVLDIDPPDGPSVLVIPGGDLGGEEESWTAPLRIDFSGLVFGQPFERVMLSPSASFKTSTAPPLGGCQDQRGVEQHMLQFDAEIFGDPDFDYLRISGGYDFGLPSPGFSSLTRLPSGDWNVDSFFDVEYRIEFVGAPGSILDGIDVVEDIRGGFVVGSYINLGPLNIVTDQGDMLETVFVPHYAQIAIDGEGGDGLDLRGHGTLAPPAPENVTHFPGGNLGGEIQLYTTLFSMHLEGTGPLEGFQRSLVLPVEVETHRAPSDPTDPAQDFETEMVRLQGDLFGDPDFAQLSLRAGTAFDEPGSGRMRLTRLPEGDWQVDSFFDVVYRIEWQGTPGGLLEGFGGSTREATRLQSGNSDSTPAEEAPPATGYALYPNVPNPFNPVTTIRYRVGDAGGLVTLEVFDLAGRHVRGLVSARQAPGLHSAVWNGRDENGKAVSSGVYFYRLSAPDFEESRKLTVLK